MGRQLMEHGVDQPTGWGRVAEFINNNPGEHQIRLWGNSGITKVACSCDPRKEIGTLTDNQLSPDAVWNTYETHAPRPSRRTP